MKRKSQSTDSLQFYLSLFSFSCSSPFSLPLASPIYPHPPFPSCHETQAFSGHGDKIMDGDCRWMDNEGIFPMFHCSIPAEHFCMCKESSCRLRKRLRRLLCFARSVSPGRPSPETRNQKPETRTTYHTFFFRDGNVFNVALDNQKKRRNKAVMRAKKSRLARRSVAARP